MKLPRDLWIVLGALPVGAVSLVPLAAPLAAVLPLFLLNRFLADPGDETFALIAFVPIISYLFASIPLFVSTAAGWACTLLLYLVLLTTNTWFLAAHAELGFRHQGLSFVKIIVALNVVAALAVGIGLIATRKRNSLRGVLVCHVGLFCWLYSVAFPWFGSIF